MKKLLIGLLLVSFLVSAKTISEDIKEDNTYIFVKITDNGIGFGKVNKTKMLTPYFTTKKYHLK